jgi:hypothetical protein
MSVRIMGLGLWKSFFNSSNCRFRSAGYIIRNRQTPIGTEIPPICMLLIVTLSTGKYWARNNPIRMHKTTHTAKYFSKIPSLRPVSTTPQPSISPSEWNHIFKFVNMTRHSKHI